MQTTEKTKFNLQALGSFLSISIAAETYPSTIKLMDKYRVATMKSIFQQSMKFSLFEQNHMPKEYFILVIKDDLNLLKTGFFLIVQ